MFGTFVRRAGIAVLACLFLVCGSLITQAQGDYLFTVDRNVSQVTVHPDDRSALIEYWLTFTCAPGAHPIDWVDIGLPHSGYDLSEVEAWHLPGTGTDETSEVALTGIEDSPYVSSGVAIPLIVRRMGKDPALVSGIFLTTITDVIGFGLMFVMAIWLLPGI